MSGNFIQRGEPAIINKWARAKSAVLNGVDLVLELPQVYCMASAEYFAFGGIKILDSLGIVDSICFGSETENIDELLNISKILVDEPIDFKNILKKNLNLGKSFPLSREHSLKEYLDLLNIQNSMNLNTPNTILGIEYCKALYKLNSNIKPYSILRISNSYNQTNLSGDISSATSIRKSFYNKIDIDEIKKTMPETSFEILLDEFKNKRGPIYSENYFRTAKHLIKISDSLDSIMEIGEGLENRIKKASDNSKTYSELISNILSKRYTITRIQRILFNILLNIKKSDINLYKKFGGPQYTKVLAFNNKGRQLLKLINTKSSIPIIINKNDYKKTCNPLFKSMLNYDCIATDIYNLSYENIDKNTANEEFTHNLFYYNK